MEHLVYCDKKAKVWEKLLSGQKTLIVRGAAGRKLPHSRVFKGEKLYFIENDGSGLITGTGVVKNVDNLVKLTDEESRSIIAERQNQLQLTEEQIKRWAGKKCLCLIEVENVAEISPLKYDRQKNMDDWITVEDIRTILEGSSENYVALRVNK
ncbi:MAG: hypothetical protein KBF19_05395 [Negativicutes bacterium]|nr:hypothetical protein [Negativicutes bacterium]